MKVFKKINNFVEEKIGHIFIATMALAYQCIVYTFFIPDFIKIYISNYIIFLIFILTSLAFSYEMTKEKPKNRWNENMNKHTIDDKFRDEDFFNKNFTQLATQYKIEATTLYINYLMQRRYCNHNRALDYAVAVSYLQKRHTPYNERIKEVIK